MLFHNLFYFYYVWIMHEAQYQHTHLILCISLPSDTFTSQVLHTLLKYVKFGETISYKRLAEMAGNIRAARAVGGAMRRNPVSKLREYVT